MIGVSRDGSLDSVSTLLGGLLKPNDRSMLNAGRQIVDCLVQHITTLENQLAGRYKQFQFPRLHSTRGKLGAKVEPLSLFRPPVDQKSPEVVVLSDDALPVQQGSSGTDDTARANYATIPENDAEQHWRHAGLSAGKLK